MRSLLIFLLLPLTSLGQTVIQGTIINRTTRQSVPFATVGLQKENIGINADEQGRFSLASNNGKPNDSLIISCIGYDTRKVPIAGLALNNVSIELSAKPTALKEVVVRNNYKWSYNTLNDFSRCGDEFVGSSGYMTQLAQHFSTAANDAMLSSVEICTSSMGILGREKARFRIRIYDVDPGTQGPGNDLCEQIIEVSSKSSHVNVNMEPYSIHIPNHDFFVAVEWLKIAYNADSSEANLPGGTKRMFVRYRPSIGWTNNRSDTMQAWQLTYGNVWSRMGAIFGKTSVSISATVKY